MSVETMAVDCYCDILNLTRLISIEAYSCEVAEWAKKRDRKKEQLKKALPKCKAERFDPETWVNMLAAVEPYPSGMPYQGV